MKELPSSEFKRSYSKLREPTLVTVNGHPIATYTPISSAVDVRVLDAIRPGEPMEHAERVGLFLADAVDRELAQASTVNVAAPARRGDAAHLGFRPAPKPTRKQR